MRQFCFSFPILTCISFSAHGQWYFESGVNDAKFANYVNSGTRKTTLNSYNGFRDYSYAFGYYFTKKPLGERIKDAANPSVFNVGIGVGFDQMNLRTRADISGTEVPVHYNFGQVQGRLTALFAPTLFKTRQPDAVGIRRPALALHLEGGVVYNYYTSATRTVTTNKGYIADLRDNTEFVGHYPAYVGSAGLNVTLNRHARLYAKYAVENAFGVSESNTNGNEHYSTLKRRVMVGLLLDFRLNNKLKFEQQKQLLRLKNIETKQQDSLVLQPLYDKIEALEAALNSHKHATSEVVSDTIFKVETHDQGFIYLPEFKHVLFPLNSSYFNELYYESSLTDLAAFMEQNPQLKLNLVGYADSATGTQSANLAISERRAKRVYDFLVGIGVPKDRMKYMGAGETEQFSIGEPIQNRRTEIIFLQQ